MAMNDSYEARKKFLEDALAATNDAEKSQRRIEELEKLLKISEGKSKQADKILDENTKLKKANATLKASLIEAEKKLKVTEVEVSQLNEKQTVLKQDVYKKDQALAKYKTKMTNGSSGENSNEYRLQLVEKDKLIESLKEELMFKDRIFIGADKWNQKCSIEKAALKEEVGKMKNFSGSDAFGKILSLEEVIADREKELNTAKTLNEQLAVHIYGLEAKVGEIPKMESKIRVLEMEIDGYRKKSSYENLFSRPPPISPSLIIHPFSMPPPQIAKKPPTMEKHLIDLEKQMSVMASEIAKLRLKQVSADEKLPKNGHVM